MAVQAGVFLTAAVTDKSGEVQHKLNGEDASRR